MRIVFLAALLLCGCGNDSGSDGGDQSQESPAAADNQVTPVVRDITRINADVDCYQALDVCDAFLTFEITGGGYAHEQNKKFVVSISDKEAPAGCDTSSQAGDLYISVELKLSTKYFIRACLFDKATATYTPGIVLEYTTDAKT